MKPWFTSLLLTALPLFSGCTVYERVPSATTVKIPASTAAGYAEPGGELDFNFGLRGVSVFPTHAGAADMVSQIIESPTGAILASGTETNATQDLFLYRLNSTGDPDFTFAASGKASADFGGDETSSGFQILANGAMIHVGTAHTSATHATFGMAWTDSGAKKTHDLGTGINRLGSVIELPSGKLVGIGYRSNGNTQFTGVVVRMSADGTLDSTFGTAGMTTISMSATSLDQPLRGLVLADGKILAVGLTNDAGVTRGLLVRLNENGSFDTTFNGTGKKTFLFGNTHAQAGSIAVQPDGKIVTGGTSYASLYFDGTADFGLARFNADGTNDTTFGNNGALSTGFGGTECVRALMLQPNGKIVAVGESLTGTNFASPSAVAVARVLPNGALDATFGSNGQAAFTLSGYDYPRAVYLQKNGGILVGGGSLLGTSSAAFILRIN